MRNRARAPFVRTYLPDQIRIQLGMRDPFAPRLATPGLAVGDIILNAANNQVARITARLIITDMSNY